jgi:pilus assembly protein CpaB
MNKRFVAVLIFAFFVATGASMTLYRLTSNRSQPARAPVPTVKLVLASRDLELGTILRDGDLVLTDWPGEAPAGAAFHTQDVVGRGVITKIYAKEPILEARLAPKGAGGGFAATIPQGMRAVAVPVNEVVGVAGFAVAGMHVDVIISGTPTSGTASLGTQTTTLLQNIEVLSAGQDFKKDAEGKPVAVQVVNLLVTPEQAEQLSLASHQTTIQLVLRNPLDREVTKPPGVALSQLFGGSKPKRADPPAPAPRSRPHPAAKPVLAEVAPPLPPPPPVKKEEPFFMEIISGSKKVEHKFESGGEDH